MKPHDKWTSAEIARRTYEDKYAYLDEPGPTIRKVDLRTGKVVAQFDGEKRPMRRPHWLVIFGVALAVSTLILGLADAALRGTW